MQNVMPEYLLNSSNDCMKIYREKGLSFEEKITAIYLRALEPDIFRDYKPKYEPAQPEGYLEDYQDYLSISAEDAKTKCWKKMLDKYKGYFKHLHEIQEDNWSNFCFLSEMRKFFSERKMMQQTAKITLAINDYLQSQVVDWMFKK